MALQGQAPQVSLQGYGIASGAVPPWQVFSVVGAAVRDPSSVADGAVSMNGDYCQIPVQTALALGSLDSGYTLMQPLPANFLLPDAASLDNPRQVMQVRVEFESIPAGSWAASLGIVGLTANGAAAGILRLLADAANTLRAYTAEGGTAPFGMNTTSTVATGYITVCGATNLRQLSVQGSCGGSISQSQETNTTTDANLRLGLLISHRSAINESATLSVRALYRFIDTPVSL
jgi:hypothetical protein